MLGRECFLFGPAGNIIIIMTPPALLVWNLTLSLSGMSTTTTTCIAPKITETLKPYHDDNVGTQSAGVTVHADFVACVQETSSDHHCVKHTHIHKLCTHKLSTRVCVRHNCRARAKCGDALQTLRCTREHIEE